MEQRGTREALRDLDDVYERRDFERVAALIHEDIDWVMYAPMSVFPFAGPRHGRTAVLQALAGIAQAFVLENYKPEIIVVDGERAAVISDVSFSQRATQHMVRFRVTTSCASRTAG